MTPVEVVFSIIGTGVGIVITVYIPLLMSTLRGLKEEFHKMNVIYERRITKLEVLLQSMYRQQQRANRPEGD